MPVFVRQQRLEQEIIPVKTRRLQVYYLEKMGDDDLIHLYTLCRITVESWHQVNMQPAHIFGDPASSLFEKDIVFQETLLRHGSWFLFAEVCGFYARAYHRRELRSHQ